MCGGVAALVVAVEGQHGTVGPRGVETGTGGIADLTVRRPLEVRASWACRILPEAAPAISRSNPASMVVSVWPPETIMRPPVMVSPETVDVAVVESGAQRTGGERK